jgi:hypothetical protein
MDYSTTAFTEEQIVRIAVRLSTTTRGMRIVINRIIKQQTKNLSLFKSAVRYVNKIERANGEMSPLEYAYALEHRIGELVNAQYQ